MCHKWGCQGGIGSISNQNYFFRLQKHKNHRTPGKKKHQIRLFLYDFICHILNNYIFSVCEGNRSLRFNFSSIAQNNILLGSVSNMSTIIIFIFQHIFPCGMVAAEEFKMTTSIFQFMYVIILTQMQGDCYL